MFFMDQNHVNLLNDPQSRSGRRKKIITISIIAGLFLFGLYWGQRTPPPSYGITLQPKQSIFTFVKNFLFKTDPVLEGQEEDRVNILLLGMGGAGHDGPYLTDTNIIVSIKPTTKEVAMISVPRDLGVEIPKNGVRKINHANAFGELAEPGNGGEHARQVFEQTFGLPIHYYVRVDFKAFTELVDTIGGITVNVPRTFTDTAFPGANFSYRTVQFTAGTQTMDGETALDFARSRHGNNGEGSDFARSHRQQLVIMALKDKMLSIGTYTNPNTVQNILNAMSTHVTTNLNIGQLMYLAGLAKEVNRLPHNLVLDNAPGGYLVSTTGDNGAFLLFPKTGDYTSIQMAIQSIFQTTSTLAMAPIVTTPAPIIPAQQPSAVLSNKITPVSKLPMIKIEIQNGTWRAGLAARFKESLKEQGFTILTVGNSLKKPIDKTAIYVLNSASSLEGAKILSNQFKAPLLTVIPDWLKPEYNNSSTTEDESGMKYNADADILIILGTDTP